MRCCNRKTLNNLGRCLPAPPTEGDEGQLVVSDGNGGTRYSNSLLMDQPAVISGYAFQDFTMSAGADVTEPVPGSIVALNVPQTSSEYFKIFDANGFNVSGQRIWVMVNYSMTFGGTSNSGERLFWLQIVQDVNNIRYGQSQVDGTNSGVIVSGNAVFSLGVMEQAQFWCSKSNAGGGSVTINGGLIGDPATSQFQTFLIN